MLVDVTLAGHTTAWAFNGSNKFGGWAKNRPWLREGGVCVVRTDRRDNGDVLVESISRLLRGLHAEEGRFAIRRVQCGAHGKRPFDAILDELGITSEIGPHAAREPLRAHFKDRPSVFVLAEEEPVSALEWERFIQLVEHFTKATEPVKLCVIVLDSRGVVPCEPVCDFSVGRSTGQVLADAAGYEEGLFWTPYLHQRVGWEAGGNIAYAHSLSDALVAIRPGDDDALESALQLHAEGTAAESNASIATLKTHVGGTAPGRPASTRAMIAAELLQERLLWRPPSVQSPRVVPWASRALLKDSSLARHQVWALRHNLVCAPLAAELLALCLHSESHIRTQLHGKGDIGRASQATRDNRDRFLGGNDEYVVYPRAHPARPTGDDDLWAFATLGETLTACSPNLVPDAYWSALQLRNGIAHGHYVGWKHVRHALRHLRRFDAS